MDKVKKSRFLIIILAFFLAIGTSFIPRSPRSISDISSLKADVALADEDEDDGEEEEDRDDEEEDEGKEDDENDDSDEADDDSDDEKDDSDDDRAGYYDENGNKSREYSKSKSVQEDDDEENEDGLEDEDEDGEDDDDISEDIQDVSKDINKLEFKIGLAAQNGGDITGFEASLNEIRNLLSQAQDSVNGRDVAGAESNLRMAESKADKLEDQVEGLLESDVEDIDEDDDAEVRITKEYKNSVAGFVHSLLKVADKEDEAGSGGIGQQVRLVAREQNESRVRVEGLSREVEERDPLTNFLLGPKYETIDELRQEIARNQTRIRILNSMIGQLSDESSQGIVREQIQVLQEENIKLQAVADEYSGGFSLFGWLVRMFS